MDLSAINQLVPGVSSGIGAAFIAGKPAPTDTAQGLRPMRSRWEQLSCIACAGLIAGKPAPTGTAQGLRPYAVEVEQLSFIAWTGLIAGKPAPTGTVQGLRPYAVEVGAGLPAIGPVQATHIHARPFTTLMNPAVTQALV